MRPPITKRRTCSRAIGDEANAFDLSILKIPIPSWLRHFLLNYAIGDELREWRRVISGASIRAQPECKQISDTEQCKYGNNEQDSVSLCGRVNPAASSFCEAKRFAASINDRVANESHRSPRRSSESFGFKCERGLRKAVIVARLNVADLRLSLLQLCLAQLNN